MAGDMSDDAFDQMFDEALNAIMEEKKKRALEHPEEGDGTTSRSTPDHVKIEDLERELSQHPFFLKEMPKEGEPLPPLLEAFQQLKYSETDNTREDLLNNYKQDALFHFKLKKWRTAATIFTEAMKYADDPLEMAKLNNNRAACQFHLENYGSAMRDSEKALSLDPNYVKAYIRILQCCAKLQKWDQLVAIHKKYNNGIEGTKENKLEISKLYLQAVRSSKLEAAQKRKSEHARKQQDESDEQIIQAISSRGIRMSSKDFLHKGRESLGDNRVKLTPENELVWPVLIFYPHIAESDLIKEFSEHATLQEELEEVLDKERPGWDDANEFVTSNINVYFTNMKTGKSVKVGLESKLCDILKHEKYELPGNGVPVLMVFAKGNRACEMMLSKLEIES